MIQQNFSKLKNALSSAFMKKINKLYSGGEYNLGVQAIPDNDNHLLRDSGFTTDRSTLGSSRAHEECKNIGDSQEMSHNHLIQLNACMRWTHEEDQLLMEGIEMFGYKNSWKSISNHVKTRTPHQCAARFKTTHPELRKNRKKWTYGEDLLLIDVMLNKDIENYPQAEPYFNDKSNRAIQRRWLKLNGWHTDELPNKEEILIYSYLREDQDNKTIIKAFKGFTRNELDRNLRKKLKPICEEWISLYVAKISDPSVELMATPNKIKMSNHALWSIKNCGTSELDQFIPKYRELTLPKLGLTEDKLSELLEKYLTRSEEYTVKPLAALNEVKQEQP